MPKSNAVPIHSASESEVFVPKARVVHTLAMTVTLDPGKPDDRTVSVSDERLIVKAGEDVQFDVHFVSKGIPVITPGTLEVRFSDSGRLSPKPMKRVGSINQVQVAIDPEYTTEFYSVFFDGVQLRFVSKSNPPLSSPSLVIQPVGDPPGGPGQGPTHAHPGGNGDCSDGDC